MRKMIVEKKHNIWPNSTAYSSQISLAGNNSMWKVTQ
uniref:Uncharacterized protein n=1 Tax=Arundo donax TaxID=35708 RepID=A0A0A8YXX4_ARUDO